MVGKPPVGQDNKWSVVKTLPQRQWEGVSGKGQLYRRRNAPRKADLVRANPCAWIGSVESQIEAPFSEAKSILSWGIGSKALLTKLAAVDNLSNFSFFTLILMAF